MAVQFLDFYQSLDPDPAKRGKQFEHFVKWFLKADPEWATQVDQIWLWDEWPGRWGADCGIDLVFQHKDGKHWAVQAKCYSPNYDITKHDVDKFLSESNRPSIQHRLLISTTDRIGANAKQVCDAQDKPVIRFLLSDFEKSGLEYPANLSELPQAQRKPRPEPRDHQIEARSAVVQGLQTADRGQLIMACGTGKTYVTLWIKEALNAQRTLVLVPSLGLLSQLLREWTFAAATPFEVLCVCSDQTVGSKGNDEAIHSVADLAFPVTSDVDEVKNFLGGAGNRVVFSTYQSSLVVAAAQADAGIPAFDLAVADEAHRCAGKVGSDFTAILDNMQIRSTKRLFATATPRTYSSTVHKAAADRGVEVVGMDNAALFGEVLYALPFGKAIERKLLTDYRVVIIGVDDPTIAQWIAKRELVSIRTVDETQIRAATNPPLLPQAGEGWDEGREHSAHQQPKGINTFRQTDSESLAAQIGLLKAIKDYDLKRIISFHSRVKRAEDFTTDMQNTMQWISDEHRPSGALRTDFVSGNMPANKRKIKLDQLKKLNADERGVLSNARCLSEGVDVPSLDGVAFIDPRSSQVDIIQAVGRAIRLSPDKKAGTIVLPVFIAADEDAASTIEASNFKPIWDVLNALKAHDDVLACELDQIRTEMGRQTGKGVSAESLRKISIDLPTAVDADLSGALRTYLVEQVTASWNFWFGLLQTFAEREGHCLVPVRHKTVDGYRLGVWVNTQRTDKGKMPAERKERLEALPQWAWDAHAVQWDEGFSYLKEFVNREGHARVAKDFKTTDGFKLGGWVSEQRDKRNNLLPERKVKLEALPRWSFEPFSDRWEDGFQYLKEFVEQEGHANIPTNYRAADGYGLGGWVGSQRTKGGSMPSERKLRLEALPGWIWNAVAGQWENGYRHLLEYVTQKGNTQVANDYRTEDGFNLGIWVGNQRRRKERLSNDQIAQLDTLPGWCWAKKTLGEKKNWDEWLQMLKAFADQEGHARVPADYRTTDGFKLGGWVGNQRRRKERLSNDQIVQLDTLPGWCWAQKTLGEKKNWDEWLQMLKAFADQEGHARVPADYRTTDGFKLGDWVIKQRSKKDRLSNEQIARLDTLPGWCWDARTENWDDGFRYLMQFADREGHARVPADYRTTDGFNLGGWVSNQRSRKDRLSNERIVRLDTLPGWCWDARSGNWDDGFRYLKEFASREGHARVHRDYKTTDGFSLGVWVGSQRGRKDGLSNEQINRLDILPGWSWDVHSEDWDDGFRYLKEFADREGHSRVPLDFKATDGYRLGKWVSAQRQSKTISLERKWRLDTLPGWTWNAIEEKWEEGFRHLKEFAEREGHAKVPVQYKTLAGFLLGAWVNRQRISRNTISSARKVRLDALPGWVWQVNNKSQSE